MTQHHFAGRIVVGYDGSPSSEAAALWGCDEARTHGRGLVLLTALTPPVATGGLGVGLPPGLDILDAMEQSARAELYAGNGADFAVQARAVAQTTRSALA